MGDAFNKVFEKRDKVSEDKYYNDNSVYIFNNYRVSRFNEISSIDSKFVTVNKFYKDIKKLEDVKSKNKGTY